MIESIRSYLGTPYRWGGNSRYGIDCSGFTQAVYREQGIYIPRVSRQQFQIGKPIASENLQFGDLVFFNKYGYGTISHVGIYIGNGQFVHATTREGVAVSSFNKRYYRIRYVGAKRLV
jgi:cell wall-associated NlpC family hydrolase